MLDHIIHKSTADGIRHATDQVIRTDGLRALEPGGKAKTKDFDRTVIKPLK